MARASFQIPDMATVGWEFERAGAEGGTDLGSAEFAVVDLETTGTGARHGHRVTEIAIVVVRGQRVERVFESLVNPERSIPPFITQLTGIDNRMVRRAPVFREIAGDIAGHLAGRVFVAHNAAFDWTFLEAEYARVTSGGMSALASAQLCTVRLARRVLRHLPRRNLDAVCAHYGISIDGRHRAGGDAYATALGLVALIRDAERSGVHTLEALLRHARRRTPRAARPRPTAMPTWSDAADGA